MRRYFNTEGRCRPDIHYMVRLDDRLVQIRRQYVDRGKYFAINRGRQYGKTTTLKALAEYLKDDYMVLSIDFQGISSASFENENKFVEALIHLKPIINGSGNYYIEAQTRDSRRTDVIVDYHGEQFIIELKIWRGNEYRERGERQFAEYLDYYHQEKRYLLSFNFNKKKETGIKKIQIGEKTIIEVVV